MPEERSPTAARLRRLSPAMRCVLFVLVRAAHAWRGWLEHQAQVADTVFQRRVDARTGRSPAGFGAGRVPCPGRRRD